MLPGYAKYLRDVGPAVNVVLGGNYDAQLSSRYGGTGEDSSKAEALLERIGATITLSGRWDTISCSFLLQHPFARTPFLLVQNRESRSIRTRVKSSLFSIRELESLHCYST